MERLWALFYSLLFHRNYFLIGSAAMKMVPKCYRRERSRGFFQALPRKTEITWYEEDRISSKEGILALELPLKLNFGWKIAKNFRVVYYIFYGRLRFRKSSKSRKLFFVRETVISQLCFKRLPWNFQRWRTTISPWCTKMFKAIGKVFFAKLWFLLRLLKFAKNAFL